MNKLLSLIFCCSLLTSCGDKTPEPEEIETNSPLKELLVETIAQENIPGIIAATLDADGIRMIESAGVRKIGSSDSLTTDDLIHLGSCTKAMTSTLLATLVADGDLTWETTFIEVFPELESSIHEDYHGITLHQLLTHRSGVAANAKDWWSFQDMEIKERRIAIIKDNLTDPSQVASGQFLYSNLSYMIAGSMAEQVTGVAWETLMQDRLFDPLAMTSAGFGAPGTSGQTDQPWGHYKPAGSWQALQADNAEVLGPAGTVHSSFTDWAKFITLQLPQSETDLLSRDQLNELISPAGEYTSGWSVGTRDWANGTTLNHSGSNTLWYVVVWVAPNLNRAYIVGTNSYDENSASMADSIIGELIKIDQE